MPRPISFPIEFAVTPRFDVFYALYSLTSSAPSQVDSWKERTVDRLPADFDRAAKQVAQIFRHRRKRNGISTNQADRGSHKGISQRDGFKPIGEWRKFRPLPRSDRQ